MTLANWIYSGGGVWTRRGETPLTPYQPPTPPPSRVTPWLPWDMPSRAQLAAAERKVYAHYMTPFLVSVNNADPASDYWAQKWLPPGGTEGTTDHRPYGGLVRNRPLTRPPRSQSNYEDYDKAWEVRQAIAAFLDGFFPDIFQVSPNLEWTRFLQLVRGTEMVNDPYFKLCPMPDGQTSGTNDPTVLANNLATVLTKSIFYRRPNGRLMLSAWAPELAPKDAGTSESVSARTAAAAFWQTCIARLVALGLPADFLPCYVRDWQGRSPGDSTSARLADYFDPFSIGHANWGARNPGEAALQNPQNAGAPARCHSQYPGKLWMHPVSLEDERPGQHVWRESWGWKNLDTTWAAAITGGADWVQLPTWNDYAEGSEFAPSRNRGWAPLDINTIYLCEYKLGFRPTIVADAAYLIHRAQPVNGVTYDGYALSTKEYMTQAAASYTGPKDVAQVMVFLTAPADVTIRCGSTPKPFLNVPAGQSILEMPLVPGLVSAEITRSGVTVASVTTGKQVSTTQPVQSLSYYAAGSLDHITRPGVAA